LIRNVPLTFVTPFPSKSRDKDILAVKTLQPLVFSITLSTDSISVIPSMEWDFLRDLVAEQEAKSITINTTPKI
jgi:hypothetical protein